MTGRKRDFTLTKLDDLFSTQEQRDDERLAKIRSSCKIFSALTKPSDKSSAYFL